MIQNEQRIDAEFVTWRLEEMGRTLLALPSANSVPAGARSCWPAIIQAAIEAYGYNPPASERARPPVPTAQAISRMDEAMRWIVLIPQEQRVIRRVVWMRALISPRTDKHVWNWRRIGREIGADYRAVQRWHAQGIDKIVAGLNRNGAARMLMAA